MTFCRRVSGPGLVTTLALRLSERHPTAAPPHDAAGGRPLGVMEPLLSIFQFSDEKRHLLCLSFRQVGYLLVLV
jgi:hypothetical protein